MNNTFKNLVKTLIIILCCISNNAFAAEEKVGVVGAANLNVTATDADNEKRDLMLGNDIFFKDTVSADDTGNAQLLFVDKSALTIGSNSSVTIDEFVYNPATSSGNMVMRGTKGTFRFIGGALSKKNPVKIKTPVGTIGIRGGIAIIDINPVSGATNATFVYGDMMTFQNIAGDVQTISDMGQGLAVDNPTAIPQVFQATTAQMASQMQALAGTVGTTGGAAQVPTETDVNKGIEVGPNGDFMDNNGEPGGDEHGNAQPGDRGGRFADRGPRGPMQPGDDGGHMTAEGGYVDGEGNYHTPEEVAQHMAENPGDGSGEPGGYYDGRGPAGPRGPGAPGDEAGFFGGFFGGEEGEGGQEPEGGFFGRFFGPEGEEQEYGMKPGGDGGRDTPEGGYIDPEGNYHSPQEVAEYRAERVPGGQYYGGGSYYGDGGGYPGGPNDRGQMTSDGGYVDPEGNYHNAGEVDAYMMGHDGGFNPGGPNDPGQLTADGGYIDPEGNYHNASELAAFRSGQLDGGGAGYYDPNGGGGYYDPNGGGAGYYDPNGGGGYYGGGGGYYDPNSGAGYYDPNGGGGGYYDPNGGGGYYDPNSGAGYYDPNGGGGYYGGGYDPYYDPNGGGGYYDPYYDPNGGGGYYGGGYDPYYDPNGGGGAYYDPATGYFYDPVTGDSFYDPYFDPYANHNFDPNDPYNNAINSPQPHNGFMAGYMLRDKFGTATDKRYWNDYAYDFVFTKGGPDNRTTGAQIFLDNIDGGDYLQVRFGNYAYGDDPGASGSYGIEDDNYSLDHAGISYNGINLSTYINGDIDGELSSDTYNSINAQLPCSQCEFVHWGVWASTITNTTGAPSTIDVAEMIPYVAGELTNMPGVQNVNAIYTGDVFGTTNDGSLLRTMTGTFNSNINIVNGQGTLNSFSATVNDGANFGGGATLNLNAAGHNLNGSSFDNVGISGGGFSGTINGALFGPQAEDIGGNMQFSNGGGVDATGVYAGSR